MGKYRPPIFKHFILQFYICTQYQKNGKHVENSKTQLGLYF
jgi:hypothetical protein